MMKAPRYRPRGNMSWSGGEKRDYERDTIMCAHCGRHEVMEPRGSLSEMGGVCFKCGNAFICPACVKTGRCEPLERQIEAMEARGRMLAAITG